MVDLVAEPWALPGAWRGLGPLRTADSAGLLSSEERPLVRDMLSADAGADAPGTTLGKSWPKERDRRRQGGSPVSVSIPVRELT